MATPRPPDRSDRARRVLVAGFLLLVAAVLVTRILIVGATAQALVAATSEPAAVTSPAAHDATGETASTPLTPEEQAQAKAELTPGKAVVLGLVEGITEFLPISSTGHLLVAERIMDVGQDPLTKHAADTYTIAIQIGAILAVVVLYFGRLRRMAEGAIGKDPGGRRTLIAIAIAFVPAAIVGFIGSQFIEDHLLKVGPVVAAWIVGALVIFAFAKRFSSETPGTSLDAITVRQAVIIGAAQCFALWPGTSRSMVTILAALLVGLSLSAAIEFSFLLGLLTVTAATAYGLLRHGNDLIDAYGVINPLIGVAVAFVSAVV
ncbi:MAG: undecaprenyl-diphosphate phosphatase, partial [Acidimicrobiales bacterium]